MLTIFKSNRKITIWRMILVVLLYWAVCPTIGFISTSFVRSPVRKRTSSTTTPFGQSRRKDGFAPMTRQSKLLRLSGSEDFDLQIKKEIRLIAQDLWNGEDIPTLYGTATKAESEGEAKLESSAPFSQRAKHFKAEALEKGCPKAQHSYGLLLWSGFGGIRHDAVASARFHAAAASQNHLDGMAVLGGCLRTGSGATKNVALGLDIIEYCASTGNPTGINKKAALLESNDDYYGAVQLYEESVKRGRVNALTLFNLGWCLVNGEGIDRKDVARGTSLWKEAAALAPDEGSEEAAWYLYKEFKRDDPKEAEHWLDFAIKLGYCDDDIDIEKEKEFISNMNSSW